MRRMNRKLPCKITVHDAARGCSNRSARNVRGLCTLVPRFYCGLRWLAQHRHPRACARSAQEERRGPSQANSKQRTFGSTAPVPQGKCACGRRAVSADQKSVFVPHGCLPGSPPVHAKHGSAMMLRDDLLCEPARGLPSGRAGMTGGERCAPVTLLAFPAGGIARQRNAAEPGSRPRFQGSYPSARTTSGNRSRHVGLNFSIFSIFQSRRHLFMARSRLAANAASLCSSK